jgi:hypothetical protein
VTLDASDIGSDVRAIAEAVAEVLEERGLLPGAAAPPARVLNVADVARLLGRSPGWVYEHAGELGAFRFGAGPRARIGFDHEAIERWKRDRQIRQAPAAARKRPEHRRSRLRTAPAAAVDLIPYEPAPFRA